MQTRFLLPTIGGIIAIFIARGQEASTIATLGALAAGMIIGYGLARIVGRNR